MILIVLIGQCGSWLVAPIVGSDASGSVVGLHQISSVGTAQGSIKVLTLELVEPMAYVV